MVSGANDVAPASWSAATSGVSGATLPLSIAGEVPGTFVLARAPESGDVVRLIAALPRTSRTVLGAGVSGLGQHALSLGAILAAAKIEAMDEERDLWHAATTAA
jgi:hypothetical protein